MPSSLLKCSLKSTASFSSRTNRIVSLLFSVSLLLGVVSTWCVLAAAADKTQATTVNDGTTHANSESNGLQVEVVFKPLVCDETSKTGDTLKVHFTGYLENGTEFDTRQV